jgi:hypothetical protein
MITYVLQMLVLFGTSLLELRREDSPTTLQNHALNSIPSRLEAIEKLLDMKAPTVPYVVCPKCHGNYKLDSPTPPPVTCTEQPFPHSTPCETPLFRDGKPVKTFEYLPYEDWLGRFVTDAGTEKMIDEFCRRVDADQPFNMKDIEDGPFIRTFPGPSPNTYFVLHRGSEGRLLFSLNVDFFNIEGNLQRGAKRSMGVISLQCLNLLDGARQDIGNFYVAGIIPGVDEPSAVLAHIRHYLKPLMDSFAIGYSRGHHVARTALRPSGHTYRSAILIKVSDAKAARSVAGHADITSHHICVQCQLWHQENILRSDYQSFEHANCETYRRLATEWWTQPTEEAQARFVQQYGVRGSALWILSYWDPITSLVVDPMHTLARVQQQYTREALRLDKSDDDKNSSSSSTAPFAFTYAFELPDQPDYAEQPHLLLADGDVMDDVEFEMPDADPDDEAWGSTLPRPPLSPADDALRASRLFSISSRLTLKERGQIYLLQKRMVRGLDKDDIDNELKSLRKYALGRNKLALEWMCADLNCWSSGKATKPVFADALVEWVSSYVSIVKKYRA